VLSPPQLGPLDPGVLALVLDGCPPAGLTEIVTLSMVGCVPPDQPALPWTTAWADWTDVDTVTVMPESALAGPARPTTVAATTDANVRTRFIRVT